MNKFFKRLGLFLLITLVLTEVFTRAIIDPSYFAQLDTYRVKGSPIESPHVDYLFIGSSRVPATIDTKTISLLKPKSTVIVGGRGYATAGTHHQALTYKTAQFPDYLAGAKVFIEYPWSSYYAKPFDESRLRVWEPNDQSQNEQSMAHILLPYLDQSSFSDFLKNSKNSISVKVKMLALYYSATYRTAEFINEKYRQRTYLNRNEKSSQDAELTTDGGIRTDMTEQTKQYAKEQAEEKLKSQNTSPGLTQEGIAKSELAAIIRLIKEQGGTPVMYRIPLHTIQSSIYTSEKEQQNKALLEQWLAAEGVAVIEAPTFNYSDPDFPDGMHLAIGRRAEFTELLMKAADGQD